METEQRIFDPRAGLWLLIGANVIAFRPHTFGLELALIGLLLALMIVHRRFAMAIKWAVGYCALVVFQQFILPVSPMIIATSFTIFASGVLPLARLAMTSRPNRSARRMASVALLPAQTSFRYRLRTARVDTMPSTNSSGLKAASIARSPKPVTM